MQIDTTLSELTYNDNLIYHYAGGIALGALKRWQQAEEFFEICVCAPAQVPAALQFEAYKKLVLVQLILYGEVRAVVISPSSSGRRSHAARAPTKILPSGVAARVQKLAIPGLRKNVPRDA